MNELAANERPMKSRLHCFALGGSLWLVPVIVVALIPVFNTSGRNARQAEGIQLLGAARDVARVAYGMRSIRPRSLTQARPSVMIWQNEQYRIIDVVALPDDSEGRIYAVPTDYLHPTIRMDFEWKSGESELVFLGPELD